MSERIRQIAETIGAIQDTLRVNSDAIGGLADQLYAQIISLDLVYMELISLLPEEQRKDVLQNQFDESLGAAQNDLAGLLRLREYLDKRISDCKKHIKEKEGEEGA